MDFPLFIYATYPLTASATATGVVTGQDANDVLEANEDTYISPSGTSITLTIDLKSAISCGCLALAGENLNGVSVEVRGSTDNFSASNVVVSATAAMTGFIGVWRSFTAASYRYWRITVTGATTATRLYHVAVTAKRLLPYLDDGADLDVFKANASHVISPQGHFLGSQLSKVERKLSLSWGSIIDSDYQQFQAWAASCVLTPKAFFFVPDASSSACYFGYTDPEYKFSAPMKNGLRTMSSIPFTARYA